MTGSESAVNIEQRLKLLHKTKTLKICFISKQKQNNVRSINKKTHVQYSHQNALYK